MVSDLPQKKKGLLGSRSMLVYIDPDLFGLHWTLERTVAVSGAIIHTHSQIGIRVIANPVYLITLILHLRRRYGYSVDLTFEMVDF
jgi:hypothetical protein